MRAGLVGLAKDWLWSSLRGRDGEMGDAVLLIHESPVPLVRDWVRWVNEPMTDAEVERLCQSVKRGTPLGSDSWVRRTAEWLGLEASLQPRGRPPVSRTK